MGFGGVVGLTVGGAPNIQKCTIAQIVYPPVLGFFGILNEDRELEANADGTDCFGSLPTIEMPVFGCGDFLG